jgi:vacuolar-type H+-ATPase subunit I/STV1
VCQTQLVHLREYDGRWEGFENGDPAAGGDEASEKLVTVRSLKTVLGVTEDDAGPSRIVSDEAIDAELEEGRTETNDLDDRRTELESELREVEEEIGAMEPFATLGVDLDLLWGYDSLSVAVGEGDEASVAAALSDLDAPTETFASDGVVAAFAHADAEDLEAALVDASFSAVEVPREEGDPASYLDELEHRPAFDGFDLVAKDMRHTGARVKDFAIRTNESCQVGSTFDQRTEVVFAAAQRIFRVATLADIAEVHHKAVDSRIVD